MPHISFDHFKFLGIDQRFCPFEPLPSLSLSLFSTQWLMPKAPLFIAVFRVIYLLKPAHIVLAFIVLFVKKVLTQKPESRRHLESCLALFTEYHLCEMRRRRGDVMIGECVWCIAMYVLQSCVVWHLCCWSKEALTCCLRSLTKNHHSTIDIRNRRKTFGQFLDPFYCVCLAIMFLCVFFVESHKQ